MSFSSRLNDELSRREVELPIYGEESEPHRLYEDVYAQGIWPSLEEQESDRSNES